MVIIITDFIYICAIIITIYDTKSNIEEIDGKIYAYEFKWNPNAKTKMPKTFIETYQPEEVKTIHRENFWEWLQTYPYN